MHLEGFFIHLSINQLSPFQTNKKYFYFFLSKISEGRHMQMVVLSYLNFFGHNIKHAKMC